MDDVGFGRPGAQDAPADELLDVGARRTLPRWLGALALVAVGVAGIAIAVTGGGSGPRAAPASSTPSRPHTSAGTGVTPTPTTIQALIPAPGWLGFYALEDGRVAALQLNGSPRAVSAAIGAGDGAQLGLVFDPAGAVVWVMPVGNDFAGELEAYAAADLHLILRLHLPDIVEHAAVLDGRLYLTTVSGLLLRTGPHGRSLETAAHLAGRVGAVVADPTRHRLLYLVENDPAVVRSWSPGGAASVGAPLPFAKGDLAVVDNVIWAGGFAARGAILVRLDPRTLRAGHVAAVSGQLGPGALLAGSAEGVLFVRSGSLDEPLWCLDASSGAVRKRWSGLPGAVAATSGFGLVAPPLGRVRVINMGSCGR